MLAYSAYFKISIPFARPLSISLKSSRSIQDVDAVTPRCTALDIVEKVLIPQKYNRCMVEDCFNLPLQRGHLLRVRLGGSEERTLSNGILTNRDSRSSSATHQDSSNFLHSDGIVNMPE